MDECRAAFDRAGYWPNEVMWKAWQQAWDAATRIERKECVRLCEDADKSTHPSDLAYIIRSHS